MRLNRLYCPVKVGFDLEQIAIEGFWALTCLLGPSDEHIKSLPLLDPGKVVIWHKFKINLMSDSELEVVVSKLLIDIKKNMKNVFMGKFNFTSLLFHRRFS